MTVIYKENVDDAPASPKCCWLFDSSYNRFFVLPFIFLTGVLYTSTYDMPGALESAIEETFELQPYQFEYLYSVYSFPNVIVCFFSGVLVDRVFGLRLGAVIFSLVALFGQAIITVGGFCHIYPLMIVGRLIYGCGMESIELALNCYIVEWFQGKELNFIFGLYLTFTRLGSSLVFIITPPLHSYVVKHIPQSSVLGLSMSPFVAAIVIQVLCLIYLGHFSLKNGKQVNRISKNDQHGQVRFRQILIFPVTFWLLVFMLAICNSSLYVFVSCSQRLLADKYSLKTSEANELSSMFNIIAAVICPIPGLLVDKVGMSLTLNAIGLVLGLASQIIMVITSWNPYIPLVLFALLFCILNSCTWPLLSRVVENFQLATAFGTAISILNLTLAVSNVLAGYLLGKFGSVETFSLFAAYIAVGLICGLTVWILDSRSGGKLNQKLKKNGSSQGEGAIVNS